MARRAASPSVTKPGPRTAVVPAPKPGTDSTPKEARWQRDATPASPSRDARSTSSKTPGTGASAKSRNGRGGATPPKVRPPAPTKDATVDDEPQDSAAPSSSKAPSSSEAPSSSKAPAAKTAAERPTTTTTTSRTEPPAGETSTDDTGRRNQGRRRCEARQADTDPSHPATGRRWRCRAEGFGRHVRHGRHVRRSDPAEPAASTAAAPVTAATGVANAVDPVAGTDIDARVAPADEPDSTQRVAVASPPTAATASVPSRSDQQVDDDSMVVESRSRLGRRERFRARRVRRLIRHVDPWSVFKLTLVLNACMWFIFLVAGVTMWSVARSSGTIDNFEKFIAQSFSLTDVSIDADLLFRVYSLVGLIITLALTGAAVIGSILFNLISDLIGGVWVSVIEEESAEPV
ncbi:MAG: DUF3566 domain-containing protein [Microthrixaceae bacterium]